ncbi:MAG: hypothetical protein HY976_00930, partial [Candidatus Kerfeldbacteria bacterium]|nr:hypothetical protein [Candidatus Kerfeldbacteria bacterium]
MISLRRQYQLLIAAVILTAGALWVGSASALTMTPRPPTVLINGPTAANVSWTTDSAAGPNHVWYGSGGPEWTEFTGLAAGDTVRDIDVFDSNRAFLVASTPANTGRLYVGNRQTNGVYAWNEEMSFAFIPNAVAAQDYDTVWFAGYSATVYSRKIQSDANGSFNVTLNAPNIIWALEEVNGTVWVGGTNTVLFSYNTATSGPVATRPTGITSIDPGVSKYTKIDAYDGNAIWAVADLYVSATFNGGSNWVNWNPQTSSIIEDIKAVAADLAYGVGRNGWIYRLQGTATSGWTKTKPTSYDLLSLGAGSPTMLMAFGCCSVPASRD